MEVPQNNDIENYNDNDDSLLNNDNNNNIKQELKTHSNINNKDLDEVEEEKEMDPSKQIELLFESLLEMYGKKQFKKILNTIVVRADKEEKFNLMEWKLLFLRTQTLLKILENKNSTYYKSIKIPHFSEYIQKINNDINMWIPFIQELIDLNQKKYANSFTEFLIFFILQKCLILSKYNIHFGHIKDAIAICSLGMRLIMRTFQYFKSPDTFELSGEILLNLSSLLIAEQNYQSAKNILNYSIRFSYMSLELKLFKYRINYKLFNLKEYKIEHPQLLKIFFNLSVSFYQLGVCYEHEGDPYNAFYAIKTSKFFGNILKVQKFESFLNFIKEIENRLLLESRIVIFFEKFVKKEDLEEKEIKVKKVYNRLNYLEEERKKKFVGIEKKIGNLKLMDVDDDEPDLFNKVGAKPINERVLKATKQVHLLEYLMSDNFKGIVHNMKKIEINKLEKDTINKIQKKIISLKNNEREKINKKIFLLIKKLEVAKKLKRIKKSKDESKKEENKTERKMMKSKYKNKSNTIISTSFTTSNTKKPRIHSAYINHKRNVYTFNNPHYSNKTLKNYNQKYKFNESICSSRSRFISLYDNGPSNLKKFIFSRDKILSGKKNNIFYAKGRNDRSSRQRDIQTVIKLKRINIKTIPRYKYNNFYFNKRFKKKYEFLESQYDKELAFQKQLLKSKFIKEHSGKPESINIKDIQKSVDRFYFSTYENELMNAKEKQNIFNVTPTVNPIRKTQKRALSTEPKQYSILNTKKEVKYLSGKQINDQINDCINDITNKISKISSKEKEILIKKRKLLK